MSPTPPPPTPSNPAPPGVVLPTVLPLTTNTSTPQQSAYQAGINASNTLSQRNNLLSAGGKRRKKGGAAAATTNASTYLVPQFNMLYNPNMGSSQTPNNIIQSSLGTMGQNTANSQYDTCVGQPAGCTGQLGGTKVCNSNDANCWGCYSGGRRKRRNRSSKKKNRKTTGRKRRTYKNRGKRSLKQKK